MLVRKRGIKAKESKMRTATDHDSFDSNLRLDSIKMLTKAPTTLDDDENPL